MQEKASMNGEVRIGVINMMASVLQILFQLSAASGLAFMVLCTVSVIISFVRGGIKISKARDETDETDN